MIGGAMADGIVVHPSRTDTWNHVYTLASQNLLRDGYTDNFYKGRALLRLLRERGKKTTGGYRLVERVNLGVSSKGGSYAKGTVATPVDADPFTAARYPWAYYREPVVVYFQDEHQATSPEGRVRLVEEKTTEAGERLRDLIASHLTATTKAASTDVNTLREAIPADPTSSGAFGELDGAAGSQPGWRNKANTTSTDWSAAGLPALRELILSCSEGGRFEHDAVLVDQTRFSEFLDIADGKHTLNSQISTRMGTKVADLGTTAAGYMNRPIIWDYNWDANQDGKLLVLNFDGIQLVEDSKAAWKMTQFESGMANGLDARVAWMRWVGQLTVSNRRILGTMTALT